MLYIIRTSLTSWVEWCIYLDLWKVIWGQNRVKWPKSGSKSRKWSKPSINQTCYTSFEPARQADSKSVYIVTSPRSSEVKFRSKSSNKGQIGPSSRNIADIHIFGLEILSRIQIQDYLRSNQVIKGSNLGQNRQIRVKLCQEVEIYPIHTCFDSKFCREFKFKIIWGQIRSSRGQTWVKIVKSGSNQATHSKFLVNSRNR